MSDPAGEKKRDSCVVEIRRTNPGNAEEVAHMIEGHNDHNDAADDVNRFDPGALDCNRGCGYRRHGVPSVAKTALTSKKGPVQRCGQTVPRHRCVFYTGCNPMADSIHIKLPDGSVKDVPKGSTALDVAK